jgi:YHS domain-containing protein
MTRNLVAAFAVVAGLMLTLQSVAAEQGHAHGTGHHETAAREEAITPQTTCPVMGGKINPKLYVDADGKRVYVCCQGCIPAVKKDPGRYIKKLEEQGVTVARLQTTCPVMGGKINPKLHVDADGKRIYVCCPACIPKVKEDPGKYIRKLQEQGVVVVDTPKEVHGAHDGHHH